MILKSAPVFIFFAFMVKVSSFYPAKNANTVEKTTKKGWL